MISSDQNKNAWVMDRIINSGTATSSKKLLEVLVIITALIVSVQVSEAATVTLVPNSSSSILGYRQITTGENTYSQSLAMSQIKYPLILLTSTQLDNLSADDSSYTVQAGTGNKDELLYVNFTSSGVQSVNWLTVRSITSVNTDTTQLGLWNETSSAGGGWTKLNSTATTGSYVTLIYNVSDIIDIQKYTKIDTDHNLNFSMAVWTSGSSGSTLSVDLFEVFINYMPAISADSAPPDSVTSLANVSYAPDYINWTWIDPIDSDFNGVMVYLDGMFKMNVSKGIQYYYATLLNPDRAYTINTRTFDSAGNINLTWVNHTASTKDTVPPGSIKNLWNISYAADYIDWTWMDPIDPDFSRVMIYLDGIFRTNVTKGVQYYRAANLTGGRTYTMSGRTVDIYGNINSTMVSHTASTALLDTIPPASITNLRNTSYAPDYINWTWIDSTDLDFSRVMIYLDGIFQTNISKGVQYYNATNLSGGATYTLSGGRSYTLSGRTVDTSGNINSTMVSHTASTAPLDTTPPASITSLSNISYAQFYINWTWKDPKDVDFAEVMIYLDGVFRTNASKGMQNYNATGFSPDTQHTIATRTVDTSGNINQTWANHTARTKDTIPPGSITDLINVSYAPDHIKWIWTDPADADYDHAEVYMNGISKGNVAKGVQYYNATGFSPDTLHTIATRTVDTSGNINQTWVNHTARTKSMGYKLYVPWTATTQGWTTPFVIANKGTSNANVNISYYNAANGSYAGNYSLVIVPDSSSFVFREWSAAGTDGSAVVVSDQSVTVVVEQMNNVENKFGPYEVDPSGSTEVFLPLTLTTGGWTTPYVVVNRGALNATVNITYYHTNGSAAGNYSLTILPSASNFVFREWTPGAAGTDGAARISSDQPISVLVDMFQNAQNKFGAYIPASAADTNVFLPWTATTQGWTTPFSIVNKGTVNAVVNISYYNAGLLAGNSTVSMAPNEVVIVSRENSLAIGTDGSAFIDSTQPVSVMVQQFNNVEGKFEAYTPAMNASTRIVIPWTATTQGWTTPYVIANRGSSNASVTISYYNSADGSYAGNYSLVIAPNSSSFVFREWSAAGTDGSALVVSDQPVTVVVDQLNNVENKFGSYTPIG